MTFFLVGLLLATTATRHEIVALTRARLARVTSVGGQVEVIEYSRPGAPEKAAAFSLKGWNNRCSVRGNRWRIERHESDLERAFGSDGETFWATDAESEIVTQSTTPSDRGLMTLADFVWWCRKIPLQDVLARPHSPEAIEALPDWLEDPHRIYSAHSVPGDWTPKWLVVGFQGEQPHAIVQLTYLENSGAIVDMCCEDLSSSPLGMTPRRVTVCIYGRPGSEPSEPAARFVYEVTDIQCNEDYPLSTFTPDGEVQLVAPQSAPPDGSNVHAGQPMRFQKGSAEEHLDRLCLRYARAVDLEPTLPTSVEVHGPVATELSERDCGPASVYILLRLLGRGEIPGLTFLRKRGDWEGWTGMSVRGIRDCLEAAQVSVDVGKLSIEELSRQSLPTVVMTEHDDSGVGHFLVCPRIEGDIVHLIDSRKAFSMSRADFAKVWNGVTVYVPSEASMPRIRSGLLAIAIGTIVLGPALFITRRMRIAESRNRGSLE
jgi:hypothetical protein